MADGADAPDSAGVIRSARSDRDAGRSLPHRIPPVRGRSLHCVGDRIPRGVLGPIERNLVWRAAEALRAQARIALRAAADRAPSPTCSA